MSFSTLRYLYPLPGRMILLNIRLSTPLAPPIASSKNTDELAASGDSRLQPKRPNGSIQLMGINGDSYHLWFSILTFLNFLWLSANWTRTDLSDNELLKVFFLKNLYDVIQRRSILFVNIKKWLLYGPRRSQSLEIWRKNRHSVRF